MKRAVFLDKDGTLVEDLPYNADPRRIALMPGAAAGLRCLGEAGYLLVVVSNQSGVARGYFELDALEGVRRRLDELLAEDGTALSGFYCCPHHPEGCIERFARRCRCRKPAPGLLQQAARDLGIDLAQSWMVGDILDDVEAGHAAGCRAILLDNGHETEWRPGRLREADAVAPDLSEAATRILAADLMTVGGSR